MASESQLPYRQVNICASLEMTTKWISAPKPPISPNLPTIYNLFMQNKANFRKSQVDVSIFSQMAYEEKSDWTPGENEPKTNPIKANLHLTAENAEYAEKKDIFVSDCPIEKYALYPISPCSGLGHPVDLRTWRLMENKPNSNPNKANFQIGRQTTEGRVRPSRLRRRPSGLRPVMARPYRDRRAPPRRAPRRVGPGSREAGSPRNDKNRESNKAENLQKETVQMFTLHLAVGFAILVKQKLSGDGSFAPPCLLSQTAKGVTRVQGRLKRESPF